MKQIIISESAKKRLFLETVADANRKTQRLGFRKALANALKSNNYHFDDRTNEIQFNDDNSSYRYKIGDNYAYQQNDLGDSVQIPLDYTKKTVDMMLSNLTGQNEMQSNAPTFDSMLPKFISDIENNSEDDEYEEPMRMVAESKKKH